MKKQTVLVGLSGGVDSAVTALLLKKQGFKVIGAFMINFSETKNKLTGNCSWAEDKKDAEKIAAILKIQLITLNFEKEYKKLVIDPMFKSYAKGITPNPDSLCNKTIKFPLLWKQAKKLKADFIATGHYAKIKKTKSGFNLLIPKDKNKDQTYFLYDLTQSDLKHTLFPLSNLTKQKVRKIAKKNKFPNHNKKGTSGICFVGKINMKSFLSQKIKSKPGKITDPEGKIIGHHNGIMFYTIGEKIRPSIGTEIQKGPLAQKKWYVAQKKIKSNTLIAAPEGHPALLKKEFFIKKINWINEKPNLPLKNIKVKIRHLGELVPAKIERKKNKHLCTLKKPLQGIAEGQSAIIYKKNTVLGGGEIWY